MLAVFYGFRAILTISPSLIWRGCAARNEVKLRAGISFRRPEPAEHTLTKATTHSHQVLARPCVRNADSHGAQPHVSCMSPEEQHTLCPFRSLYGHCAQASDVERANSSTAFSTKRAHASNTEANTAAESSPFSSSTNSCRRAEIPIRRAPARDQRQPAVVNAHCCQCAQASAAAWALSSTAFCSKSARVSTAEENAVAARCPLM